jgi:hypothetical protein
MKKFIGIIVISVVLLSGACCAAGSEWKETYFGKYLTETAYVKSISDEKGSEALCYIVLKENGDIEIGAEEPDQKNDNNIFLSRIFISEDGKTIKPSSSSGEAQRYGSGKILYYHPEKPGYDVFSKNCRSFMKADNIPTNIREKVMKALNVYAEQASK